MAFYSVRVDDEGKEIETTRQTFRKLCLDSLESATVRISSSQDNRQNSTSTAKRSNYTTVRYVNSATFIEKDLKTTNKLPLSEEDQEAANSPESLDFSDDIMDQQYQTHITQDCDAVPLLELNSNESFPSSNNMTYSYRKVCEVTKMIQKPDAYKEWLDAKKTAKVYEQKLGEAKKRNEEEKKKQRKILAEKKFQEWLAKKMMSNKCVREQRELRTETRETTKPTENDVISRERERESNFKAWLKKKVQQEKSEKEKLNEELKREQELEKKRREEAATIYRGWLKTAPQKPKPVPLNRGILTLKGSVSDIYMNPMPWVPLDNSESTNSI